jgi:hypothetical protein
MGKKLQEIANHIKESMCIDGTVEYIKGSENEIPFMLKTKLTKEIILEGVVFECNDKKRGKFYIGWFNNTAED